MKSLYIVRHAKSSWDDPELSDEERPLLEKGIKRTQKVIEYLRGHQVRIDLLISSHAVRAYETARIIADGIGYPVERIIQMPVIYHADEDELLGELLNLSDEVQSVMLVGHNPGFTRFASYMLGKELEWLPTSSVIRIDIDAACWKDIIDSPRTLNFMVYPRMLK